MGEPVTTGMMIGAALGGGTSALRGKDPIKGALIGGLTGAAGGAFMPAAGAGTGGGFAGGGYGSIGTAGQTAGAASSGGLFGGTGGISNMFSGMGGNMTMPSTFTGIGKDISAVNTFMNQNPTTSQIGFGLAKDLMAQDPVQMAPQGQVNRSAIQPMDYMSLLNPQQSTVIRPATPSLI